MTSLTRNTVFDLIRGAAALIVCGGHERFLFLVELNHVASLGIFDRLYYGAWDYGLQAVVVFFVLSGYLVGGSVFKKVKSGTFSGREYAASRMARIYIVLLPALVYTVALDAVSWNIGTQSQSSVMLVDSTNDSLPASGAATLIGNIFFLQTIFCKVYGNNWPLWSLANEVWCYLTFPIVLIAVKRRNWKLGLASVLLLIFLVAAKLAVGFAIWIFGAIAAKLVDEDLIPAWMFSLAAKISAVIIFGVTLSFSSGPYALIGSNLAVGGATALLLVVFSRSDVPKVMRGGVIALSDMSYTLYLSHFPFVVALYFCVLAPRQLQPSPGSYFAMLLIMGMILLQSSILYRLFEIKTPLLRKWLLKKFTPS